MDLLSLVNNFLAGYGPQGAALGALLMLIVPWLRNRLGIGPAPTNPTLPPVNPPPAPTPSSTPLLDAVLDALKKRLLAAKVRSVESQPAAEDLEPDEALELLSRLVKK